jgi:opacity protein-like surface antigen
LKLKLVLITVLAFGCMAHAQGFMSNLSLGVGGQGIFPAATTTKDTANITGFPTTQSTTDSVGVVVGARYDFGRHSALDASFTLNRDSEVFFNSYQTTTRVQTNNFEIIGNYIFRLPSNEHVKPYAMFGGGMVRFGPNNDFNTVGTPGSQMKPAFDYGFGTDFKINDHWALRLQYRGLIRSDPDFKLASSDPTADFGTGLKTHVPEPSIQLVYHF